MNAKRKTEPDDKEQSARFFETARKLEADESGMAFERALDISLKKNTKAPVRKVKKTHGRS